MLQWDGQFSSPPRILRSDCTVGHFLAFNPVVRGELYGGALNEEKNNSIFNSSYLEIIQI